MFTENELHICAYWLYSLEPKVERRGREGEGEGKDKSMGMCNKMEES